MIVITGANGFIGKNLLRSFPIEQDIIVVDYSYSNLQEEIEARRSHIYLLDPPGFLNMFKSGPCSVSFVFHQGACTDTTCHDAACMLEKNYDYTYELINLCAKSGTPLVYASSASVYGDGPFHEESLMSPKNIYAKSKSMIDDYASIVSQTTKSQITGLRYFNVYGPLEETKGKMSSVMNQFKNQIDASSEIRIFENSEQYKRDFIFVEDVVKVNHHFYKNSISGAFNCGTGESESFAKIPRVLKKYYKFDILEVPMPTSLVERYQRFTEASLEKLRTVGKYDERFLTLEEGIERYVDYWEGD